MELATELTAPAPVLPQVVTDLNELDGDGRQDLQTLNDVNKSELKTGHKFDNDYHNISTFDYRFANHLFLIGLPFSD